VQEALPLTVPSARGAAQPQAKSSFHRVQQESFIAACPECGGGQMAYEEGCMKCHICGYSECG
jgi:ribonucleoside-diphosphate reductase alpha chain